MSIYRTLYLQMFNSVTDALWQMEELNFGTAKALLKQAQVDCESLYIEAGEQETISLLAALAKNDQKQGSGS